MYTFTPSDIMQAYRLARKSRKKKQEVYLFDLNKEERLLRILADIKERNYVHQAYREIIIYDAKKRYIFSPSFRDHILHHMLYAQLYPILDAKMVHSSFACRVGYGNHRAIRYLHKIVRRETQRVAALWEELYYYKIDISKYFFSIHHQRLRVKLQRYITDSTLLYLIDTVFASYTSGTLYDELLWDYDCYTCTSQKGLPIGSILSQLFANFYLSDLDQYIKHVLKQRFVRYMDDIIILGASRELKEARTYIREYITEQQLIVHPYKEHFHRVSEGVTFVWYRIYRWQIYVWKRAKASLLRYLDTHGSDILRSEHKELHAWLMSRLWVFTHSVWQGKGYLKNLDISL